jgi:hypothetical protein
MGLGPFELVPGVGDLQEHVGVAEQVGWAPAGQRLAGELAAGGVDQLGMLCEVLAVQGDGDGLAVLGHAVGIAQWVGRGTTAAPGGLRQPLVRRSWIRCGVMAVVSWC